MKGSKGWVLKSPDLTPAQKAQVTPSNRHNQQVMNMLPKVSPTLPKRAESPRLRAPHFLDFPSE